MSPIDSAQLLKRLEPAIRPAHFGQPGAAGGPNAPLEARSFHELLGLASRGNVSSGREVAVKFKPTTELQPAQLRRLAAAADVAEASGARTALMLIDGRALVMNISDRAVTQELSASMRTAVVPIDAAVAVEAEHESQVSRALPDANHLARLTPLQSALPTRQSSAA